ncbi:transcriptional regulator [Paroceanicella profunda]|uniref:Transcriptional regulator n=1 Tax=Paroceanicella profunda TaxID=2579971 RepID=A0A5B8FRM1_9RHOB|nr:putative glycolipid-binding domain-containing protein [Paroceanicella profunda]QDL91376.1 transcriptional regulator [Paroceanicella profunda]
MRRTVRWSDESGTGLEHLLLTGTECGFRAESLVIGAEEGVGFALRYRLEIDAQWRLRAAVAACLGGPELHLLADGAGHWRLGDGTALPELDGCIDIDIAATPFTNTLPIRRLGLTDTQACEIRMAYLPVPGLTPSPMRQRYTRLGAGRYLYESVESGFRAELPVDADGLVGDYPGLFRRLEA